MPDDPTETEQLGADLAGDFKVIGDDGKPVGKDPPPSNKGDDPPPGDGSGDPPPSENGDLPPDPLKDITREQLLSHPTLGPALQNWKDSDMDGRIQRALEQERQTMGEDARLVVEESRMAAMDAEDLGTYLQEDPLHQRDFASIMARKDQGENQGLKTEIEGSARVLQIASTLRTYGARVEAAKLPKEVLEKLNPENYREKGIDEYQKDVDDAITDHRAQGKFDGELSKDLDAATQKGLAERDGKRKSPDLTPGRSTGGRVDLLETDAEDLVSSGLQQREKDRVGN